MALHFRSDWLDEHDLSLENMGSWPCWVKTCFALFLLLLLMLTGYYLLIECKVTALHRAIQQETSLKQQYRERYPAAANLEPYRSQMFEMEQMLNVLLTQLPATYEVPGLLEDITGVSRRSGLSLIRIDWEPEIEREFYIELPIRVDIRGNYHQFGDFVSGVAKLPRVVSIQDFMIRAEQGELLEVSVMAKTYRYKEPGK